MSNLRTPTDQSFAATWPKVEVDCDRLHHASAPEFTPYLQPVRPDQPFDLLVLQPGEAAVIPVGVARGLIDLAKATYPDAVYRQDIKNSRLVIVERVR